MKKFLFLFFSCFVVSVSAQTTWVNRINFTTCAWTYPDDSIRSFGIVDMEEGADGSYYTLSYNSNCQNWILKVNPDGRAQQGHEIGQQGTGNRGWSYWMAATPDSGCAVLMAHEYYGLPPFHTDAIILKYDKDLSPTWTSLLSYPLGYEPMDLIAKHNGGYYILFGDSLAECDSTGSLLAMHNFGGKKIFELPGGDLIIKTFNDSLIRVTPSGIVSWSLPFAPEFITLNQGNIYGVSDSGMIKADTNGNVLWSAPYPFGIVSSVCNTPGGGFIVSCGYSRTAGRIFAPQPAALTEVDSSGSIAWSNTYSFPYTGFSAVLKTSSGMLLTGGGYIYGDFEGSRFYGCFRALLDSSGHGRLENTSKTWPLDANNNDTVSFLEDPLYVAIAYGDSGIGRDDSSHITGTNPLLVLYSNFAADWPSSFCNGVNHKHADYNGDGKIDSLDFAGLGYEYIVDNFGIPAIIPSWRFSSVASIPPLTLVPSSSTITAGDTITLWLIAGDAANPIDSVYGLTFLAQYNFAQLSNFPVITPLSSDLGDPALNLIVSNFEQGPIAPRTFGSLVSRIDHQDAYNVADTIAVIKMVSDPSITSPQPLSFHLTACNALTWCLTPIILNPVNVPVTIQPAVGISNYPVPILQAFPNPAKDYIEIRFDKVGNKMCRLYDSLGKQVREWTTEQIIYNIQTVDLSDGVYSLQVEQDGRFSTVRLLVQR